MTNGKSNSGKWFWGIFIGLVVLSLMFVGIAFFVLALSISGTGNKNFEYVTSGSGKGKIAVVELDFTIIDPTSIVRQFKQYREDKSIKAIVLHVNSPGGGVSASQEMYEEVKKTRDAGKPVIVSFGSIAASGGYYVACGGSLIVANPGSMTGSIGVIAAFMNFKDLADKLGVKETIIKSGKLKDSGNPFREMNKEDMEYFQEIIDNAYEQFLDVVSTERKIDKDELRTIANGRVFTGKQAKDLKLVDSLGTFEDAIRIAGVIAKIDGEPSIVREKCKRNIFEFFVQGLSGNQLKDIKEEINAEFVNKPVLQYKFER
ncbi:MAG: signal peptide peptidase SppA [Ignavibacteria bacterium]|nr:signal peptide peptidase SppA [Ignavibacteria bacterium]